VLDSTTNKSIVPSLESLSRRRREARGGFLTFINLIF